MRTDNPQYLEALLDAMPTMVFVVDQGLKVLSANRAASSALGEVPELVNNRLCGDVLRCVHERNSAGGCGTTEFCNDCIIRQSAQEAIQGGSILRRNHTMDLETVEGLKTVNFLVSAAPFIFHDLTTALVTLEDITEVVSLRKIIPLYQEMAEVKNRLEAENRYLQNLAKIENRIMGRSRPMQKILSDVEQVSRTDSTVLIQGETGTGKELIAQAIHDLSSRRGRLFVKVNCAALPAALIESELFGREKGAYTGALSRQAGRFELAHDSSIFLDEIDCLSHELQAKLLRVLENGEFERLGSSKTVKVNVRIIAASNRDLSKAVNEGSFRADLFYRLNVFLMTVPPLRERADDILPLIWAFIRDFGERMGKRIESVSEECLETLQRYPWPGNVRELRNVIERAMILAHGPVLNIELPHDAFASGATGFMALAEFEKTYILKALKDSGWKVSGKGGAAEMLGLNAKTLESRMKKMGIRRPK